MLGVAIERKDSESNILLMSIWERCDLLDVEMCAVEVEGSAVRLLFRSLVLIHAETEMYDAVSEEVFQDHHAHLGRQVEKAERRSLSVHGG